MKLLAAILAFVSFFALIAVMSFGGSWLDLAHYSFFAPKFENARHEVYKNSTAFVDGTMNAVSDMQVQYAAADDAGKRVIAAALRHKLADVDYTAFPPHLRSFVAEVLGR